MSEHFLDVIGTPAPQGSKQGFVVGNRAVIVDANKAPLKSWRSAVIEVCGEDRIPLDGPLEVHITFRLPRPKSVKREFPSVKPDIDKLVRSTLDALKLGKVFVDDALVVELHVYKQYADHDLAGAAITVREI